MHNALVYTFRLRPQERLRTVSRWGGSACSSWVHSVGRCGRFSNLSVLTIKAEVSCSLVVFDVVTTLKSHSDVVRTNWRRLLLDTLQVCLYKILDMYFDSLSGTQDSIWGEEDYISLGMWPCLHHAVLLYPLIHSPLPMHHTRPHPSISVYYTHFEISYHLLTYVTFLEKYTEGGDIWSVWPNLSTKDTLWVFNVLGTGGDM